MFRIQKFLVHYRVDKASQWSWDEPVIAGRGTKHGRGLYVEASRGQDQDQDQYLMLFPVPLQKQCVEEVMLITNSLHASPTPTKCVLSSLVPLHLGSIRRPDSLVTNVGNLTKCQCKYTEGSLQYKPVDISSLGEDRGGVCDDLHNIPALTQALMFRL